MSRRNWRKDAVQEVKTQLCLAGPLFIVALLQYSIQAISVMFVGHLGELALSGASMATSFATVTGFNLLMGMASALDTLCGQSFGAEQHHMLGLHAQRAALVLLPVSALLAIIWGNTKTILISIRQDPKISEEAGIYVCFKMPTIFAHALLQCVVKFLQAQRNVFPMVITSGTTALLHAVVCWSLVFKSPLKSRGAALASSLSYWINVLLLVAYVKFSSSCKRTWNGFSRDAFHNVIPFLKISIPSALMLCLKAWSLDLMVILSGLLPNPKLETSVLSICTRVSNELGANKPQAAQLASRAVLFMSITEGIIVGTILILLHNLLGHLYSNEKEVIKSVAAMAPILSLSCFLDGIQSVLSGIARGSGWQKIGAYINLGSFYLVGLPASLVFAFVLHLKGMGLWYGIICAFAIQVVSLLIIMLRTSWEEEAGQRRAERRHKFMEDFPREFYEEWDGTA
ncbi:hypothetical protein RJ640_002715 [Escallonia rubra]|uniref:Protein DETOXIFICATION n=1 Tax=Escallonia rubra TaxID=112253 RepID=A0AA88R8H6_9ASTE|nr:hypothetical protein RJ640_002715 [Escallonia rubra]